ncbi:DUF2563 family protein [Mycolicibacterium confluentis]|uniref:Uncharacterized protein n=1 Tax=Mycolicibacterium confluentis TaxID=28047 RepID=A0A7I7Y1J8_9MYCO|nr:DUF2563 family protein [Mycolicibacterium confluentis]MCV7320428.1 DUF2563 family protein [Mycolicibacterium confluentis]ORV21852.1 hypothetical protein AWB99_05780 [Mycolicibacterium confluentis]BBZ35467.1 hypothetical protein MCNF_40720 [Mycolicibacterium confluentis]
MQVHTGQMRTGAQHSYTAAGFADEGVTALTRSSVTGRMFGDFADAEAFGQSMAGAQTQHSRRLRGHERRLGVLGDKTHVIASSFDEMEQRNRAALEQVRSQLWSNTQP